MNDYKKEIEALDDYHKSLAYKTGYNNLIKIRKYCHDNGMHYSDKDINEADEVIDFITEKDAEIERLKKQVEELENIISGAVEGIYEYSDFKHMWEDYKATTEKGE